MEISSLSTHHYDEVVGEFPQNTKAEAKSNTTEGNGHHLFKHGGVVNTTVSPWIFKICFVFASMESIHY